MIYKCKGNIHFEPHEYEVLSDIWEGFKKKYGHNEELYEKKIAEWIETLPEKNNE